MYKRQSQRTADHGAEHIGKVAQLGVSRTTEVGVTVGLIRAFKQLIIELIKLLNGFFLVAEHLNNLLAVHHLFNVAVHRTNICLLYTSRIAAEQVHHTALALVAPVDTGNCSKHEK